MTQIAFILLCHKDPEGVIAQTLRLTAAGDDLLMVVGSQDRMGRVMWRSGDHCGVRVDEPLPADAIAQMKQEAGWAEVTGWER